MHLTRRQYAPGPGVIEWPHNGNCGDDTITAHHSTLLTLKYSTVYTGVRKKPLREKYL